MLAGILLGVESGIPDEVDQAFRDTGTSHIIAISGFNITIIAGLLATLFGRLIGHGRKGARLGALIALIGIVIYTILVGGDVSWHGEPVPCSQMSDWYPPGHRHLG